MLRMRIKQQLSVFLLLLAADQWSKWWIEEQLPFFHTVVIDGFFNLVKAHNFGVAFSMFADWDHQWRTNMLIALTVGIAIGVAVWWWKEQGRSGGGDSWLLMLVLVGAVGNITDRMTYGYVVDFIDWYVVISGQAYHWPAFNIADICISVSIVLLIWKSFNQKN